MSSFIRVCALAALCIIAWAESLPKIAGENLSGKKTELPEAAAGHRAILIIGFTHGSQNQTKAWSRRVEQEFPAAAATTVYSIAVLEDVPHLVRGMAAHGVKGSMPKQLYDRFLLIYHGEKELKQAAGFDQPDDAYIFLLDPSGDIRWRFHGGVTDTAISDLRNEIQKIAAK